ncbi:hypothetical protein [Streptomyces platensis]
MHDNQPRTSTPDTLPEVITRYLTAHHAHDTATQSRHSPAKPQ